jgi:hypothetical protein
MRAITAVVVGLLVVLGSAHANPQGRIGIAMVPYMPDKGDDVEKAMSTYAGQMDGIDRIYTPNSPEQLFETLNKQKQLGRKVSLLFIMGHGSKSDPGIDFASGRLNPEDVDLARLRRDLAENQKKAKKSPTAAKEAELLARRIALVETVADAMAKDAQVVLINCSAAATPKGKQFVKNLGDALLGKRGGAIIASRVDVGLSVAENYIDKMRGLWATGKWLEFGDIFDTGKWVRVQVKPRAAGKAKVVRVSGEVEFYVGDTKLVAGKTVTIAGDLELRAVAVAGRRKTFRTLKLPTNTKLVGAKSDYHVHYKTTSGSFVGSTNWNVRKERYTWSVSGGSATTTASGANAAVDGDVATVSID